MNGYVAMNTGQVITLSYSLVSFSSVSPKECAYVPVCLHKLAFLLSVCRGEGDT